MLLPSIVTVTVTEVEVALLALCVYNSVLFFCAKHKLANLFLLPHVCPVPPFPSIVVRLVVSFFSARRLARYSRSRTPLWTGASTCRGFTEGDSITLFLVRRLSARADGIVETLNIPAPAVGIMYPVGHACLQKRGWAVHTCRKHMPMHRRRSSRHPSPTLKLSTKIFVDSRAAVPCHAMPLAILTCFNFSKTLLIPLHQLTPHPTSFYPLPCTRRDGLNAAGSRCRWRRS